MSTAMSLHTLLARLLLLTLPSALIALLYLYNYPLFHDNCTFPLPSPVDGHAPFRLLLLADPQLEGDTSLPHPDYTLSKRVRRYWADIKLSAADTVRRRKEEVIIDQDSDEQAQAQAAPVASLHTTLLTTLTTLLTADIPRSLEAARKRIDLLGNDFYLAHIYRTLHAYTSPTHVAVLGDLLGSQWISDEEFARRTRRYWGRVFRGAERVGDEWMVGGEENGAEGKVVEGIGKGGWERRLINVAGNHDIGYAGDISEARIERFESAFGKANWDIFFELEGHSAGQDNSSSSSSAAPSIHIINLNDMLLDGPPFSNALQTKTYAYLNHLLNRSPPVGDPSAFTILLTHVPLHKPAGVCTDAPHFTYFDEDDYWGRFREGGLREQNLLGEYISEQGILQGIFGMSGDRGAPANGLGRKGVILNGHDHTGCDTLHYVRRISNNASASDSDTRDWAWDASRYTSSLGNYTDTDGPSIREITLRSMMGEYGGNAGLLSLWFDDAPGVMEWKYEFAVCRFGLQHVWWAVHVVALIAILNVCLYAVSCVKLRTGRRRAVRLVRLARRERREKRREKKQAYASLRRALVKWGDEKAQEVFKDHIYQMGREWLLPDKVITLVVRNYEAIHSVDDLKRVLGKTWEFDKYAGEMYEVISRTFGTRRKGEECDDRGVFSGRHRKRRS